MAMVMPSVKEKEVDVVSARNRNAKPQSNGSKNGGRNGNKRNDRKEGQSFQTGQRGMDTPHVITNAKSDNDPSWYTHVYPLVRDYAALSFSGPVGSKVNLLNGEVFPDSESDGIPVYTNVVQGSNFGSVPGIMTFDVYPSIGVSSDSQSAPNIAAQQLYTLVRKQNKNKMDYDKTDLMSVMIAMDNAYALYEDILRVYRAFGGYDYMSRYMPDALITALGYAPSLRTQYSNLKGVLDLFAYQLASINVPDQFDFIKRHSWMFTNVYMDAKSNKAQLYAFKMAGIYVWDERITQDKPTALRFVKREKLFDLPDKETLVTSLEQIQTAINTVMTPLLGSGDVGYISGDLANAFGEGGMIKIQPVSDHEILTPQYSPEVLLQMMNMNVVEDINTDSMLINVNYNDVNAGPYFVCKPYADKPAGTASNYISPSTLATLRHHMLNFIDTDVTPENIMVSTRLCAAVSQIQDHNYILSCGTEIITKITVWSNQYTSDVSGAELTPNVASQDNMIKADLNNVNEMFLESQMQSALVDRSLISAFDWHPTIYLWEWSISLHFEGECTAYLYLHGVDQDIQNFYIMDHEQIKNLNDVALMSEFAVRDYGTALT
nr:putative capsid [Marmot picobirnavirus]